MNIGKQRYLLRKIRARFTHANWLARAVARSAARSPSNKQRDRMHRALAIALSLLFYHFFPYLVVASYMSWEGFFSYDMFAAGISGLTAFYWWSELFLIVFAWALAGTIYFVAAKFRYRRTLRAEQYPVLLVAAALNAFLGFAIWNIRLVPGGFDKLQLLLLCVLAGWVVVHMTIVLHGTGIEALGSLAVGISGMVLVTTLNPGVLALPYTLSLQFFGSGGGLEVVATPRDGGALIAGRLVLAGPDHLYIYASASRGLLTIRRQDLSSYSVSNLSGFGHAVGPSAK